jgi:hypothetical protein
VLGLYGVCDWLLVKVIRVVWLVSVGVIWSV